MKRRVVTRVPPTRTRPMGGLPTAAPKPPPPVVHLRVCRRKFVYIGPVKVGRFIPERRAIQVKITRKDLIKKLGSEYLEVSIDEFPALSLRYCEAQGDIDPFESRKEK